MFTRVSRGARDTLSPRRGSGTKGSTMRLDVKKQKYPDKEEGARYAITAPNSRINQPIQKKESTDDEIAKKIYCARHGSRTRSNVYRLR